MRVAPILQGMHGIDALPGPGHVIDRRLAVGSPQPDVKKSPAGRIVFQQHGGKLIGQRLEKEVSDDSRNTDPGAVLENHGRSDRLSRR